MTLGPAIRLWREARRSGRLPDAGALRAALARCGYRKLHLNAAERTLTLDEAGMQLDVGGIAKGYAADAALVVLRDRGIRSALVAVSGDLAFGDAPPGQAGWRIGIDPADTAASGFTRVLELSNAAVSTSGDAEQHLDSGTERYSHIIDPATGAALTGSITVTIIAAQGIIADGTATAVSVLGEDRGMAYVDNHPEVAALMVTRRDGAVRVIESAAWPRLKRRARLPRAAAYEYGNSGGSIFACAPHASAIRDASCARNFSETAAYGTRPAMFTCWNGSA